MNAETALEQSFYPDRRLAWRVLWLVGYVFLLVWWFALSGAGFFLLLPIIGGVCILGGCIIPFMRTGPVLIAGEKGVKLFSNFMGGGNLTEIPWSRISSIRVAYRSRYDRKSGNNQMRKVLVFKLAEGTPEVKCSGQFYWNSEENELELSNPPKGGFSRAMNAIGQFAPHLKDTETSEHSEQFRLFERILDGVIFSAVVGTVLLAATGNMQVLHRFFGWFVHLVK